MPAYVIYHVPHQLVARRGATPNIAAQISTLPLRERLDLNGMWFVRSEETSDQIRDDLRACIGPDDTLLVLEIGRDAAWAGVPTSVGEWLLDQLSA